MASKQNPITRLRKKLRYRRLVHGVFAAMARVTDFVIDRRAARADIEIFRDLRYGRHRVAHRLDVYRPRAARGPLPVLLYVHGGAFTICSKDTHRGIALANAEGAGYLVFNINYRLAPEYLFPAAIADTCDAYRWVVRNCERFGGDPSRIVLAGESAGGNLVLGTAIAATYRRPERYARRVYETGVVPVAVMPITPYLQSSGPERHALHGIVAHRIARGICRTYLGRDTGPAPNTLMADPIRVLEECGRSQRPFPPVFSGVGERDPHCWNDVKRLERACKRFGIAVTAHYYPNEFHAFHALQWRAAARLFWKRAFRFMKRVARGEPARVALARAA